MILNSLHAIWDNRKRLTRNVLFVALLMALYRLISLLLLQNANNVNPQDGIFANPLYADGSNEQTQSNPLLLLYRFISQQTCLEKVQNMITAVVVIVSAYYFRDQTVFLLNMLGLSSVGELPGLHDSFNRGANSTRDVNDLTDIPELIPDAEELSEVEAEEVEQASSASVDGERSEVMVFDKDLGAVPRSVKALWDEHAEQLRKTNVVSMCNGHKRELPPIRNYPSAGNKGDDS